jgi:hypothetical protein
MKNIHVLKKMNLDIIIKHINIDPNSIKCITYRIIDTSYFSINSSKFHTERVCFQLIQKFKFLHASKTYLPSYRNTKNNCILLEDKILHYSPQVLTQLIKKFK